MRDKPLWQSLWAWISLTGFIAGAAVALVAVIGSHMGRWDYAQGLTLLRPGLAIGLIGLISGTIWLWRALAANNGACATIGMSGFLGTLLLVGIPGHYLWMAYARPPIHDISTDIGEAPQFHALLKLRQGATNPPDYDGPKEIHYSGDRLTVALAQKYAYQDIKPLERLAGTMPQKEFVAKYFWRSLNAAQALGWNVVSYSEQGGTIEATDKSFWFGVVSDIVIRVRPAGTIGVRVDIRAKSRVGEADCGRNARLIRTFISKVKGG